MCRGVGEYDTEFCTRNCERHDAAVRCLVRVTAYAHLVVVLKDPRVFYFLPKIGVFLFFAKMASKTPPPFAKALLRAELARQILIMVVTTLSYALAGSLRLMCRSVLEL